MERNNESQGPRSGHTARRILTGSAVLIVIVAVLVLLLGSSSWYTLKEDQFAVVTTFGKPAIVSEPGLKFKVPLIQRVTKVSKNIQGFPLGYRIGSNASYEDESLMITYDYNFVNVDYTISPKEAAP